MKDLYSNQIEEEYSKSTNVQYRRSLGQFFTPFRVAKFMSEWILGNNKKKLKILDPSAGFGIFERALKHKNKELHKKLDFDLWEIDKQISKKLSEIASNLEFKTRIYTANFLSGPWEDKYDGIISNPPYYKHHYIKNKNETLERIYTKTHFQFSIQTNIYCWFLIKSMNLLDTGGRLAFILPGEFFNANYGEKVKDYLRQSGLMIHLINIYFKENIFNNALTTSIIIFGEKGEEKQKEINFYNVDDINNLRELKDFLRKYPKISITVDKLDPKIKWRNYFNEFEQNGQEKKLISFSMLGHFSRGIATGANRYFTLTEEEKEKYGIPEICLIPCITKARHIKDIRFTKKDLDSLRKENKKVNLFDGERSNEESCKKYIERGEEAGIHERYLTKNRIPWYALEKRKVSKIWVSVFVRSELKFIWNETDCINLTCFHAFYATEMGKKYLNMLFLYLNTNFARKLFDREKREYGNGLAKFEPNDINKAFVFDFNLLNEIQVKKLREMQGIFLFSQQKERTEILRQADDIFKKAF